MVTPVLWPWPGIIAGLPVICRSEILVIILGALFVAEVSSVIVQVISFRITGRYVFRNSWLHHYFELMGLARNRANCSVLAHRCDLLRARHLATANGWQSPGNDPTTSARISAPALCETGHATSTFPRFETTS